ncbi:MAG: hypothetical protein AAB487_01025 [Patescibacteria group bacterium]
MAQEFFLDNIIALVRGINLTPIIALYCVLGFVLFLTIYHWSGAAEGIENLSTGKKLLVFILLAAAFATIYYIFYKAGKFEAILNNSLIKDTVTLIKSKFFK